MAIAVNITVHPGGFLKSELIEAHGLSVTEAARLLHVSRQALSTLLNENAGLSADMAIRFEKVFGVKADTLLRMQTAHDLAQARAHESDIVVERFEPRAA